VNHRGVWILLPEPGRSVLHGNAEIDAQAVLARVGNDLRNVGKVDLAFARLVVRPHFLDLNHREAQTFEHREVVAKLLHRQVRFTIHMGAIGEEELTVGSRGRRSTGSEHLFRDAETAQSGSSRDLVKAAPGYSVHERSPIPAIPWKA